jgi:hypothetical protein
MTSLFNRLFQLDTGRVLFFTYYKGGPLLIHCIKLVYSFHSHSIIRVFYSIVFALLKAIVHRPIE